MLLEQMKKENYKRLKASLEEKEKVNTNFGPEENEMILQNRKNAARKNLDDIRTNLEKQMTEKYQKMENEKIQERIEDLETLANSKMVLLKERQ